jgi:sugar lactone lactonase YvrE
MKRQIGTCFVVLLALAIASPVAAANLYVMDYIPAGPTNGVIYSYTPSGSQSTYQEETTAGPIAVDASGDIYLGQPFSILKIPSPAVTTVFTEEVWPLGLAFDHAGTLYVSDSDDAAIFKYTPAAVQSTLASGFDNVQDIALDSSGDVFLADGESTIYKITPAGHVTTFATGLSAPVGLAFNAAGDLFASAVNSGAIYEFTSQGHETEFASGFSRPWGLAFDSSGNLFVANSGAGDVDEITPSGHESIFASGLSQPLYLAFAVPEPSGFVMFAMGIVALGALARTRRFSRARSARAVTNLAWILTRSRVGLAVPKSGF